MRQSQTMPTRWLIARSDDPDLIRAVGKLPRGSGLLLLEGVSRSAERAFRMTARRRGLRVLREHRGIARRVHNIRELRAALLEKERLILLSPLYPTSTHPDWKPIPRMRAAALARLGGRKLIALGGMNEKRFASLKRLGFLGWAGITSWMPVDKRA